MSPPLNESSHRLAMVDVATLLALIAAWLYSAGWTYALHYFRRFEVGLLALEIPHEYYLMYGFWVLKDWWWVVMIAVVLILLGWLWHPVRSAYRQWPNRLLLVVVCLAFFVAPVCGVTTANRRYEAWSAKDFAPYPRIKVWLKHAPQEAPAMPKLVQALPRGCYRLLVQNKSTLFLFRPRAKIQQAQLAVVAVPKSEVWAWRVMPQYDSCR